MSAVLRPLYWLSRLFGVVFGVLVFGGLIGAVLLAAWQVFGWGVGNGQMVGIIAVSFVAGIMAITVIDEKTRR